MTLMSVPTSHSETVRIDCRGIRTLFPRFEVEHEGRPFEFILDDKPREGRRFHAGLFVNNAALLRDAFRYPKSQRLCVLLESPINECYRYVDLYKQRFSTIFTHQQHLLEQGSPFREFYFGTNWLGEMSHEELSTFASTLPAKSKAVSFMGSIQHQNAGAYQFREEVARYCLGDDSIDCFGKGIKEVEGKAVAIAPYYFSIAMENAASDYYFSEKLIDCILLETVPIYYGCEGISELLDPRGLLQFNTLDELKEILPRLTAEKYESMHPFALENKRRILEHRWASFRGLFERMAECLSPQLSNPELVSLKGVSLKSVSRRLVSKLSGAS